MKKKGQSLLEYALLISAVAAAFIAMQTYVRRAVNANLKSLQDQLNETPQ